MTASELMILIEDVLAGPSNDGDTTRYQLERAPVLGTWWVLLANPEDARQLGHRLLDVTDLYRAEVTVEPWLRGGWTHRVLLHTADVAVPA